MQVTTAERQDVVVFFLNGRFDAYRADGVRAQLFGAVEKGQRKIVVDLSGVTLVDSNGLTALVGGMKRARQDGGDLRLVGIPSSVRLIFDLTHVDRAFEIFEDIDSAVASFAG